MIKKIKSISKRVMLFNGILIFLMVILLIALLSYDNKRTKILYNGRHEIQNAKDYLKNINGETYIDIDFLVSNFSMFKVNNGVYGEANEDPKYFYIESPYEAVQFENDTTKMVKYIIYDYQDRLYNSKTKSIAKTEEEEKSQKEIVKREKTPFDQKILAKEIFTLNKPIVLKEGKKYISIKDLKYTFNIKVVVNPSGIYIYDIDYLEAKHSNYMAKNNFKISNLYQNRRSIIDDDIIVESNGKFGVLRVEKDSINSIIGRQYDEIRYSQSGKNVYILHGDKLGLKSLKTNKDIIAAGMYDGIEIFDDKRELYIVKEKDKLGLINSVGEKIIPIAYKQIGLTELQSKKFTSSETNGKLIADNLIPVMKINSETNEENWTLFTLDGKNHTNIPIYSLGFNVPSYVEKTKSDYISIPDDKQELATSMGINSTTIDVKNTYLLKKLNITLDSKDIEDGMEDTLVVPKEYKYSGVIVQNRDPLSGEFNYAIINKDTCNPVLAPVFKKIYKIRKGAKEEFYRINVNDDKILFEKDNK